MTVLRRQPVTGTMRRTIVIAIVALVATPASAELRIPCLWNPFGGCSVTLVSPEYAKQARAAARSRRRRSRRSTPSAPANGREPLVLDERLSRGRRRAVARRKPREAGIGHTGTGGSTPKARAARAGYPAKIASENVGAGFKSFGDMLKFWTQISGHRTNLLRQNVAAIGIAMATNKSGRPYWTLVLGGE